MAKATLFMAIFNSCLYVYQGVTNGFPGFSMVFHVFPGGNLGIPNEKSTDFAMISRCLRTVRASSVACLGSADHPRAARNAVAARCVQRLRFERKAKN